MGRNLKVYKYLGKPLIGLSKLGRVVGESLKQARGSPSAMSIPPSNISNNR